MTGSDRHDKSSRPRGERYVVSTSYAGIELFLGEQVGQLTTEFNDAKVWLYKSAADKAAQAIATKLGQRAHVVPLDAA